jgi:hypothetical protein
MTHDFERVRQSARTSAIAGAGCRVIAAVTSAWASSAVAGRWRHASDAFRHSPPPARLRWWAIAIGAAAVAHVGLRALMSSTVAPAMPMAVYIAIAAGSALVAWQAQGFQRAWHGSRLSRLFHDRH